MLVGANKDTIEGTTQISAKLPQQTSHVLSSQEEDKKQELCTSCQKMNGMCVYKRDQERPKRERKKEGKKEERRGKKKEKERKI